MTDDVTLIIGPWNHAGVQHARFFPKGVSMDGFGGKEEEGQRGRKEGEKIWGVLACLSPSFLRRDPYPSIN